MSASAASANQRRAVSRMEDKHPDPGSPQACSPGQGGGHIQSVSQRVMEAKHVLGSALLGF